jgi:hypothetical protein
MTDFWRVLPPGPRGPASPRPFLMECRPSPSILLSSASGVERVPLKKSTIEARRVRGAVRDVARDTGGLLAASSVSPAASLGGGLMLLPWCARLARQLPWWWWWWSSGPADDADAAENPMKSKTDVRLAFEADADALDRSTGRSASDSSVWAAAAAPPRGACLKSCKPPRSEMRLGRPVDAYPWLLVCMPSVSVTSRLSESDGRPPCRSSAAPCMGGPAVASCLLPNPKSPEMAIDARRFLFALGFPGKSSGVLAPESAA